MILESDERDDANIDVEAVLTQADVKATEAGRVFAVAITEPGLVVIAFI